MPQFLDSLQAGILALRQLPADYPQAFAWYTLILRFLFPLLALAMLVRIIRSLIKASPKQRSGPICPCQTEPVSP